MAPAHRPDVTLALARDPSTGVVVSVDGRDVGPAERAQHGVVVKRRAVGVTYGGIVIRDIPGAEATESDLFDRLQLIGWLAHDISLPRNVLSEAAIDAIDDHHKRSRESARREVAVQAHTAACERRVAAAMWLRNLYVKTGLAQRITGNYGVPSAGSDEISDAEAWNRKCFQDVWKEIGRDNAGLLEMVICHEQLPAYSTPAALTNALDALAKWRGL